MPVVDNKIVNLEFDNAQFESGVATSLQTIALLKKQLNSLSSSADFDSLTQESSKFNFGLNTMASGLKGLSDSFSSLGIIGITALSRLTNAAIDAGTALVKSLTVAPVSAGWDKYEKTITATKTIMNATNKDMITVEKQLDRLSFFSDETSYSFTDMADAIGKFTANGQDLDKSVTAVQGIATWAATAGQNTQTANAVMYQLSQAVGSGMVRAQDWKSVETMNMATEEFKQTAIDTAIAMGLLTKAGKTLGKDGVQVTTQNFRSTLEKDWFTADVFIQTLTKYGSYADEVYKVAKENGIGAADAMELMKTNTDVFGKKAFTAAQEAKTLTDAINATKDAVSSGWSLTSKLIFGNYEEARVLFTDLAGALNDIFAAGGVERNRILLDWKKLGGRTVLIEALGNAWNNLMAAIEPVKQAWTEIFPPMTGQTLYNITVAFKKLVDTIKMGEVVSTNLKKAFKAVFSIFDTLLSGIGFLINQVFSLGGALQFSFDIVWEGVGWFSDLVLEMTAAVKSGEAYAAAMTWLTAVFADLKVAFEPILTYLSQFYEQLKELFTTGSLKGVTDFFLGIGQAFTNFITSITTGFSSTNLDGVKEFSSTVVKHLTPVETIGKVLEKIFGGLRTAFGFVITIFVGIGKLIGTILGKLFKGVGDLFNDMTIEKFFNIINNILKSGLMAALLALMTKLYTVMGSLKDIGDSVSKTLDQVQKAVKAWQDNLKAKTIMTLALALAVLTAAIVVLSMIDVGKLGKALAAMALMFTMLMYSFQTFAKAVKNDNFENVVKVAVPLIGLGVAVFFLASALAVLAKLNTEKLVTGLITIMVMLKMLATTANSFRKTSENLKPIAISLIFFAAALWLMTKPILAMSSIPFSQLIGGLIGLTTIFVLISRFLGKGSMNFKKIMDPKNMASMIILAAAMNLMANAVKMFAMLDPVRLILGLAAFGAVGYGIQEFVKNVGNAKGIVKSAAALLTMAVAMNIFALAVAALGILSGTVIVKGLATMAAGLLILGTALYFLAKPEVLYAAAAIFAVSAALAVLAPVLLMFSLMNLQMLGMALLGLAGVFAVFGVATLILAVIAGPMLLLGAAMLMVGVATISLGIGLQMLSAAFLTLALTAPLGGAALVLVLTSLIMLIPLTIVKVAEGIVEFVRIIGEGATTIATAFGQVFTAILEVLFAKKLIVIAETVKFVLALLQVISDAMPQIVELGAGIIIKFLEGYGAKVGQITDAAITLVLNFLGAITARLGDIVDSAVVFVITFIQGLADSIDKNQKAIGDAVWDLIVSIIAALFSFLGSIWNTGKAILDEWVGGLGTAIENAWNSIVTLGKDIIKAVIEGIGKMGGALWDSVVGTVEDAWNGLLDWLGIESPSKKMAYVGKQMGAGLVVGMDKMSDSVSGAAENLGKDGATGISKAMSKIADTMDETSADFHPEIVPVVDMSNFNQSLESMTKAMGDTAPIKVQSIFSLDQAKASVGAIASSNPNTGNEITDAATKAALYFTQNNYSPKSLSRLEIYRQTKNQFSALKGLVTGGT